MKRLYTLEGAITPEEERKYIDEEEIKRLQRFSNEMILHVMDEFIVFKSNRENFDYNDEMGGSIIWLALLKS